MENYNKILNKASNFYIKNENGIQKILLILSFCLLFATCVTYPYLSDDLIYMNKWQSSIPLQNLTDIWHYQIKHYFAWGGENCRSYNSATIVTVRKTFKCFT